MSSNQRNRGRILTPDGLSRLQQAIRTWEVEHEVRCTQERIKELTSTVKEGGLDPGTIRKILKAKDGVDPESIRCLFTTFGLQLAEADLVSSSRLQIQVDPNFVGREGAIGDLNTLINRGAKVIVIQARGGVGKTTLARKYLQQEFGSYLEFPIAKETKDIASIESLIEEKLRQLGEEPGREFFVSLDRLKRKLQDERIGILIDNLEPALDSAGKFIEPHRRYVELLRVLADPSVQSITLITTRERLRESSITVEHYILKSLGIAAWEQFFQSRHLSTDTPAFAALHNAYGGNAKAMDIIRGAILEDYSGDIAAYWQANQNDLFIERDLEDLVTQQFDRLQQIDTDAYNLLCRMGCYRYQDVPTVPIEGLLCLLWDVPENRQRRVVKSLQDRSLVEFEEGEYWLHPVIRSEAIGRLRQDNWRNINQKVAEFWTNSIKEIETITDALAAFEAYHHYVEIAAFEEAGKVILNRRPSKWHEFKEGQRLDGAFHQLGLIQQMSSAILQVINNVDSEILLIRFYRSLSRAYRLMGDIHQGIKYAQESIFLANRIRNNHENIDIIDDCNWSEVYSLVNIGICKIELGEFEEAISHFEEASSLGVDHIEPVLNFYFALVYSYLGIRERALLFLEKSYAEISIFKLNAWARGDRFVSLGMAYSSVEDISRSVDMYNQAILYAEESQDSRIKAIALYGLASLEREMEEFKKAIQLFSKMEAPKQVERVRRSIQTHEND